jgi:hydrogenase expression/formation protein HypC
MRHFLVPQKSFGKFRTDRVITYMCLAIPAKVLEIRGDVAKVDFGQGVAREVNVMLVEARVGEYVLVHAGYAIQTLDQEAAEESLRYWREILEQNQN